MNFEDIYFVSDHRAAVPRDDFSDAESRMRCMLPEAYKHLLKLTGGGEFCSHFRFHLPDQVAGYVREWRDNASQYHFYEERAAHQVPLSRLAQSIYLGGTLAGDSLVALPDGRPMFAPVPDDCDHLIALGDDLGEAVATLCTASDFGGPAPFLYFTPDNPAETVTATWMKQGDKLPDVIDTLLRLRLHNCWYTTLDESVTSFFVKSFGGKLECMTIELQEPGDSPPTGEMRSGGQRFAAPPEMLDFSQSMIAGGLPDCSELGAVPPFETWQRLPDIPPSVMITIRLDAGRAASGDLLRILKTLETMGMRIAP